MRIKEIRKLKPDDQDKKLRELKLELLKEKGNIEMGGNIKNPGRIKVIRKDIAKLNTLKAERLKSKTTGKK
ncbi:50S ribosomal protein L29 [Candidatus Micrarchaeota archaeon RBG_16_49_10]|nr:MAG: 50S ribosomal protein L29 [Candidatus Micrarchaeota archaeon RBG_16_49_10]